MKRIILNIKALIKNKIVRNGLWLFLLQGFNTILPLITVPYITRILSTSLYGEFSLGLNWITYLQLFVEFGFGLSATRKLAANRKNMQKIYNRVISARLFLFICSFSVFCIILYFLPLSKSVKMCIILLCIMAAGTVLQHTWFFQGMQDMKAIAICNMASRLISTMLIFLLVNEAEDIYLYCILYASNYVIMAILGTILAVRKYNIYIKLCSFKEITEEIRDGWNLFISSALTKIITGFGVTFLGFVATSEQIGRYSAIQKIPYLLSLLWGPINQTLFPLMSQSFSVSWENGEKKLKKICVPILGIYSFVALFIILIRSPLTEFAFGKEYLQDSDLVIPLILWIVVSIVNNFVGIQTLVASGNSKEYSMCIFVSTLLLVFLTIVLGYRYTTYGVACASLISEVVLTILLFGMVKKIRKERMYKTI